MDQQRRNNNFRTKAKLHFLTYPQCDVPVVEMISQLQQKYADNYGWLIICAEDHEERENDVNVGVHRHVMTETKGEFNTRNAKWWDITYHGKTYHPHFEPVKNKVKCLEYVMKDGDFIYDGSYKDAPFSPEIYLQANKKKQGYGFTYIATEIKAGKTIEQLDDVIPGLVLNNKRKIQEYVTFQEEKKQKAIIKPKFPGFEIPRNWDWRMVAEWINKNFMEKRELKQPQLWLWSRKPNMGKTYPFSIMLREYFNCYEWVSGKQDKVVLTCDYILIDEFKGNITVGELKSLSQMYGMNLDIKYDNVTYWNKNVPLIITSNRPPREIYTKIQTEEIESLLIRFDVIEVDEECHLKLKVPDPEPEPQPQPEPDSPNPEDMEDENYNSEDHSEYSQEQRKKSKK